MPPSWGQAAKLLPWKGRLWHKVHTLSKPIIRKVVHFLATKYFSEVIRRKEEEGWINPEVKLFYDELGELMEKEKNFGLWDNKIAGTEPVKREGVVICDAEHAKGKNLNEVFFEDLRNVVCGILDEDSFYTLRFFYVLEMMFRDQEKFRIAMHRKRAYWNWDYILKEIRANSMGPDMKKEGFEVYGSETRKQNIQPDQPQDAAVDDP